MRISFLFSQAIAIFSSCAIYSAAYKKMEVRSSVDNDKQKTLKNKKAATQMPNGQLTTMRNKRKVGALAATNKRSVTNNQHQGQGGSDE